MKRHRKIRGRFWRRSRGRGFERLEQRRLLATDFSGVISSDTTWTSDIRLVGDVRVTNNAQLTITSGVNVMAQFGSYDISVASDGSSASLVANGAVIDTVVNLSQSASAALSGNTILRPMYILGTEVSSLSFSGNTFNAGPHVQAEFVPQLASNTFGVETDVFVGGIVDKDGPTDLGTVWPKIPNVSEYVLDADIFVRDGVSLEIASGVSLSSVAAYADLFVSDDNSGASLIADDVSFSISEVFLHESALGQVINSDISGVFDIDGTDASLFDFGDNTVNVSPVVHAEYLPKLSNNQFVGTDQIRVDGDVDMDLTWPKIANVNDIVLANDVRVLAASTLTISPGIALSSTASFADIFVSNDQSGASLIADGVTLGASDIVFDSSAGGRVSNSTIAGILRIEGTSNSTLDVHSNVFNVAPQVHAEFVPRLINSQFVGANTVFVFGSILTDTNWFDLSGVHDYQLLSNVQVNNGSRLNISSGVTIASSSTNADLFVSTDQSSASIVANNASFLADRIVLDASATGSVVNSTIGGLFEIQGTKSSTFQFSGNEINHVPTVHAEYVPRLKANSFVGASSVNINGNVQAATVWPNIDGVDEYQLVGDVRVMGVGTLEIERGTAVYASSGAHELFVGDPASTASLDVVGSTLGVDVVVFPGSSMRSRFTTFTMDSSLRINSGSNSDIHFNDFQFVPDHDVIAEGDAGTTIDLTQNWWGTVVPSEIEDKVLHEVDDANRPLVIFEPFLLHPLRVPDYLPAELSIVSDAPFIAGSQVEVSYEIINESLTGGGGGQSAALFYLSTDGSLNGSRYLGFVEVESLVANSSTGVLSEVLTLPGPEDPIWSSGLPHTYEIGLLVDASNVVMEYIEENNTISIPLVVSPQVLVISESSGSSSVSEGGEGDTMSIALTSVPSNNVTVTATPDGQLDLGAGGGVPIQIAFTPDDALNEKTIHIDAIDDESIEGRHEGEIRFEVTSDDPQFQSSLAAVRLVDIADNDSVQVSRVVLNNEAVQRSQLESIDVVFNTVVDVANGAVNLINQSTGENIPVAVDASTIVDGVTRLELSYDASLITDGNYQLTVRSDQVAAAGIALDGDSDGIAGVDFVDHFYRLFGDVDGDKDVDYLDFAELGRAALSRDGDSTFDSAFDFDSDDDVDGEDMRQFYLRFLGALT